MPPQHYPVEPGKLHGGEFPGDRNPEVALIRLRSLVTLGIRTFLDLTAPADRMTPYEKLLAELEVEFGAALRRISLPIIDMQVPENAETTRTILGRRKSEGTVRGGRRPKPPSRRWTPGGDVGGGPPDSPRAN